MERLSDTAIEIINELHGGRLNYEAEYLPLIDSAFLLSAYEDTGLTPEGVKNLRRDGWVSVEDRLPEIGEEVLVFYDSGEFNIDYFCTRKGVRGFEAGPLGKVTHWKPLTPPREEAQ